MVDVSTGGQPSQIGGPVIHGQMGQTRGLTGDLDAPATNRIVGGDAVAAVRPPR